MPTYLLAYHGGKIPKSKAEQPELKNAWNAWMGQLGDALEGSNNPIRSAKTIGADGSLRDGGGANPVVGLSFVDADDIDAAIELAKSCPHLSTGGSIEVAELTRMDAAPT